MLTCRELIGFLNDYVEGALAEARRRDFDAHLRLCPRCIEYLDSYRRTIALGREALDCRDEQVPPDVPEDLVRAILASRAAR
jgi:anti-sigma factor RsiW